MLLAWLPSYFRTGGCVAPFVVPATVGVAGALVFLKYGSGQRQVD